MSGPAPDIAQRLRESSGDQLTRALIEAPPGDLGEILANPSLREDQLLLLLRRPDLPAEFLSRIAEDGERATAYLVKAALVTHPHTPKVLALGLVKYLFWRDLAKLVGNFQIEPTVRRMAEVVLKDRLGEISPGERVALARMAPREVIKSLRAELDPRVIGALLANPRLTEDDLIAIAGNHKTPPAILALVARSDRWVARYPVRLTLVRNPRTPFPEALLLLPGLAERDLHALADLPECPPAVRSTIKARLKR